MMYEVHCSEQTPAQATHIHTTSTTAPSTTRADEDPMLRFFGDCARAFAFYALLTA